MAGNSNVTLQDLVDDASTFADLSPALQVGGFTSSPAMSIANDVMAAMVAGGPDGQPLNWKWNRVNIAPFPTISGQQDYFVPGVVKVGWLENGFRTDINQQSTIKNRVPIEVKRDLDLCTYPGVVNRICWENNDTLATGTWGAAPLGPTASNLIGAQVGYTNETGQQNPGPSVIYTNPIGAIVQQPYNATTSLKDPNGNLWVVTTYGTCGSVQPTWPTTPVYPTYTAPTTVATTVTDGTVVWTAINPKGQGFRISPRPPINGVVWLISPVAQMRPVRFSSLGGLGQTLDPIPDDYSDYFKTGFFAGCVGRSPDAKTRARFAQQWALWLKTLDNAVKRGSLETDDRSFVPVVSIMDIGDSYGYGYEYGPANWPLRSF